MKNYILILCFIISGCIPGTDPEQDGSTPPDQPSAKPVAAFTFTSPATDPSTVQFQNTSTGANSFAWDFGDGTRSRDASPRKSYPGHGMYTVTLIATDTLTRRSDTTSSRVSVAAGSVVIEQIAVDQIPFTDARGNAWDRRKGPDLYPVFLENGNVEASFRTHHVKDLKSQSLPVSWAFSPVLKLTDWNKTLSVSCWDYDGEDDNQDDYMGITNGLSINDIIDGRGYVTSVALQNSSGTIRVRLILGWR